MSHLGRAFSGAGNRTRVMLGTMAGKKRGTKKAAKRKKTPSVSPYASKLVDELAKEHEWDADHVKKAVARASKKT